MCWLFCLSSKRKVTKIQSIGVQILGLGLGLETVVVQYLSCVFYDFVLEFGKVWG